MLKYWVMHEANQNVRINFKHNILLTNFSLLLQITSRSRYTILFLFYILFTLYVGNVPIGCKLQTLTEAFTFIQSIDH